MRTINWTCAVAFAIAVAFGAFEQAHSQGEELPIDGIVRLIQHRTHRRHLGVFEYRIPARFLICKPMPYALTMVLANCGGDMVGKVA